MRSWPSEARRMTVRSGRTPKCAWWPRQCSTPLARTSLLHPTWFLRTTVVRALAGRSVHKAHDTRAQLLERAELAGAKFACHFYRSSRLRQVVPDTAETDDAFYRKSAGCMPFEMIAGQSFAIIVFTSPSSAAASKVHASHDQPQTFLALVSWRVSTRLCACM